MRFENLLGVEYGEGHSHNKTTMTTTELTPASWLKTLAKQTDRCKLAKNPCRITDRSMLVSKPM